MNKARIAGLIVLLFGIFSLFLVFQFVGKSEVTFPFWSKFVGCALIAIWVLFSASIKVMVILGKKVAGMPVTFISFLAFFAVMVWAVITLSQGVGWYSYGFKWYHDMAGLFMLAVWPIFDYIAPGI